MDSLSRDKMVDSFSAMVAKTATDQASKPGTISSGWGLDPDRHGPMGLIVYVASNDLNERNRLLGVVRKDIPSTWEGHPVYFKGIPHYGQ